MNAEKAREAAKQLRMLCRDVNNGLFSASIGDDIRRIYELYSQLAESRPFDKKEKKAHRFEMGELIKIIYISTVNVTQYELDDYDRVIFGECIAGIPPGQQIACRGFAYFCAYYAQILTAFDFIRIGRAVCSVSCGDAALEQRRLLLCDELKHQRGRLLFCRFEKSTV